MSTSRSGGRDTKRFAVEENIARFVRDVLWKKIKFTSDTNMLFRSGAVFKLIVVHLNIDKNMSVKDWKRYSSVIRKAMNGKRNNCSGTMKSAFMSLYYLETMN